MSNRCVHLRQNWETQRFINSHGIVFYLCDYCAARAGFCVLCGAYEGPDMTDTPQTIDVLDYGGAVVVEFGTVVICDDCAGIEQK